MQRSRPSFLQKVARAAKAARMVFSGMGGAVSSDGYYGGSFYNRVWSPGASWRYEEEVGNLWDNAALRCCLNWIQLNVPEARCQVVTDNDDGEKEPIQRHALENLLRRPNPYYSGSRLWMATALSFTVDGNAFWIKARGGTGRVLELWHVPPWEMAAEFPRDGSEYITRYVRTVNGQKIPVRTEDVVHFRWGEDPLNGRMGLSPISAGLRQIAGDNNAATYVSAILRNFGVVGGVFSVNDPESTLTKTEAEILKAEIIARHTGEHVGEPLVVGVPMRYERAAMSPEDVMLKDITNYFEERICALLLINPIVVGLGAGMDRSTFSNYDSALRAAYQNCIVPMQRIWAEELEAQLLPDLGDSDTQRVAWDYTDVKALQEDQNELRKSLSESVKAGWMKVSDARKLAKLESGPEDEVYRPAGQFGMGGDGGRPDSAGDRAAAGAGANGNGRH